jgi:SAM-dependent methyltransferase
MKIAKECVCCNSTQLDRAPAVLMPFVAYRVFAWEPTEITPDWGLRDLRPGHAYALCSSLRCRDCGLLFLDMRFDAEEMKSLYQDYRGEDYRRARERFEPGYSARNELLAAGSTYIGAIEKFLAPHLPERPRVLDWGGDTGLNTPFRSQAALHHVYDISDKPMVPGALHVNQAEMKRQHYDLIVLSQVLEHVPHPRNLLTEIADVMQADTLFYLELPYEEIMRTHADDPMVHKHHWHEHINFFTETALDRLHESCGLHMVARAIHEVHVGGRDARIFSILSRIGDGLAGRHSHV